MQVEQSFQDLSVIYCELTSLLVLVSHQSGTRNIIHRGNRLRAPRYKPLSPLKSRFSQADLVESYVIRLLQGDGGSGAQLPRPISAVVYTALLPTIWALLNQGSGQQPEKEPSSVLMAVLGHAMRTTPGSAVKRLTVEFVGRLLLVSFCLCHTKPNINCTSSWRKKQATPAILTLVAQVQNTSFRNGSCTFLKPFGK